MWISLINGIIQYAAFCVWLLLPSMMLPRFIHVIASITILFLFKLKNISFYGYTSFCLYINQLMNMWIVSTFWLLLLVLLWTYVYKFLLEHLFLFIVGIHPERDLIGKLVILFNLLRNNKSLFTQWLHHFTFPLQVFEGSISPRPHLCLCSSYFIIFISLPSGCEVVFCYFVYF